MRLHREVLGAGEPIVLVHGFTQTIETWRPLAQALATDHRVTLVDAPGHGRSSAVRANLWQGADLLAEAGGKATYVGYSMGARLALHLALAHPDHVEGLVLLGATAGIDSADERVARRESDEALAEQIERDGTAAFLDRWLSLPLFAGLDPNPADLQARRFNEPAGLASSLRLAGTGTQDPPLWERLHEITAPTLVAAGALDTKFSALGRRIEAEIGTAAEFELVEGAGHAAHLERPEAFLTMLRAWLDRRLDRRLDG